MKNSDMDIDVTKMIESWIHHNDVEKLLKVQTKLSEAFTTQNKPLFWRAAIEKAGDLTAHKLSGHFSGDPLASIKVLVQSGLSPNIVLDKAERPVFLALHRGPILTENLLDLKPDLNVANEKGQTPLQIAIEKIKTGGEVKEKLSLIKRMVETDGLQWNFKDQGAFLLFELPFIIINQAHTESKEDLSSITRSIFKESQKRKLDFNLPRGKGVSNNEVKINTPLAYFLKKMNQWHELTGCMNHSDVNAMVSEMVEIFLEHGADPSLQMEKSDRLALMEICRHTGFEAGLAERLEAAVLRSAIKTGTENASSSSRSGKTRL